MKKVCSLFRGVLFGAVVGSAIVLLFTPWSGDELKQNISEYVNNFQDDVRQAGTEKRQELEMELEKLRSGKI